MPLVERPSEPKLVNQPAVTREYTLTVSQVWADGREEPIGTLRFGDGRTRDEVYAKTPAAVHSPTFPFGFVLDVFEADGYRLASKTINRDVARALVRVYGTKADAQSPVWARR